MAYSNPSGSFGPMAGSANRIREIRPLQSMLDKIDALDSALMEAGNQQWDDFVDNLFAEHAVNYWAELDEFAMQEAIDKAKTL